MTAAVCFEDVSKHYPSAGQYRALRDDVAGVFRRLARRELLSPPGMVRALEGVSFAVPEGEAFAIIGPNGAGKSTALKILSRISYPTGGVVRVRGRVGALIEVGTGLHPELTGRENVWLYGRILGISGRDIGRRFGEIVEFAEVETAIDRPVKQYSSGMQLRLGFAIASHLDPDVFVVDEALAVGDAGFQSKCVERMTGLVSEGRTLLFVSHNLFVVETVCRRGLFLLDGRIAAEGTAQEVVAKYLSWVDERQAQRKTRRHSYRSRPGVRVASVTCHDPGGAERYSFGCGEDIEVRLRLDLAEPLRRPLVSLGITDGRPGAIALASMQVDGNIPELLENRCTVACRFKSVPLLPGVYEVLGSVIGEQGWGEIVDWQPLVTFRITQGPEREFRGRAVASHLAFAPVFVDYEWAWAEEAGR